MTRTRRFLTAITTVAVVLAGAVAIATPASAVAPSAAPELLTPGNGETVSGNPILSWTAVPGAVKYRVQVSVSLTFSTVSYSADTFALHATPIADLPRGVLYWRVAAMDASTGVGPWPSTLGQFTREPASQPTLLAPADEAVLTDPTAAPVLRWSPLAGVKNYRVELREADESEPTAFTTSNTALALAAPVILDKDYFWHVKGLSATSDVTTDWSEMWRFSSSWRPGTGQPALDSPLDGVDVTDVVFRWGAVAGARNYEIEVSPNGDWDGNNPIDHKVVDGTQYSPATTYDNGTYFWHVRTLDNRSPQGHGPWSSDGMFKRSWLSPPGLVSPRDGEVTASQRFEWTPIAHASSYEVQLSNDPNFSQLAARCTTFNTTVTPSIKVLPGGDSITFPPEPTPAPVVTPSCEFSLVRGAHYYWRVRGLDYPAGVNGAFSDATDFVYMPDSPTVLGPAEDASVSVPVLSWEPLQGYSWYRVTMISPSGLSSTINTYSTTYTPTSSLTAGGRYSWYVVGVSGVFGRVGAAPVTADQHHFVYTAPTTATDISWLAAADDTPLTMPSMTWQPMQGALYYKVYSRPVAGGAYTVLTDGLSATNTRQAAFTYPDGVLPAGSYEWFVEAFSSGNGYLGRSAAGMFAVDDLAFVGYQSPPNCVPPDCADVRWVTPELRWAPITGAGLYKVTVALDKDFTHTVRSYITEETTLTPRESYLDNQGGHSYFWYVQPCKYKKSSTLYGCGPEGAERLVREQAFRKQSIPVQLVAPAYDEDITDDDHVSDVVTFSWQDYRETADDAEKKADNPGWDAVGAQRYRLQVATDDKFASIVDDVTVDQTTYQAWADSYPDNVYYWRVWAIDGGNAPLTASDVWRFQKSATVPAPPLEPAEETTGLPTLHWDAMPYASGYTVEIYRGDSESPWGSKLVTATTKLPAFTPTAPLPADTYSWRVRKLDPEGNPGPWSEGVPTFSVEQDAPAMIAPEDAAEIVTDDLLFSWNSVAGAAAYRFESALSTAFANPFEHKDTVMTSWAPTAFYVNGATYYWRVSVLDGAGNVMDSSAPRSFVKDSARPRMTAVAPTSKLAVDGTITMTFDEPVHIDAGGIAVKADGSATAIAGAVSPGPETATTTATFRPASPLIPGQYYDVVAGEGIVDRLGNAVVPSQLRIRTVTSFENTSPALAERWDLDAATAASGGSYMSSRVGGTTAVFTFTGPAVSVLGHTGRAGGNADVLLDGAKQATVSFYDGVDRWQRVVFSKTGLAAGPHTLTLRVLGTKAAAATAANVDLDGFRVGSTTYQEADPAVRTTFTRANAPAASSTNYDVMTQDREASGAGAEYRFTFRGKGFSWAGTKSPTAGSAVVYIDGVYQKSVSQYSKTVGYKSQAYSSPVLYDRVHTVRIILTGVVPAGSKGTSVSVDTITTR